MLQCNPWSHNPDFLVLFLFVWFLFVFAALCLVGLLTYSADLQPCCYGLFLFLVSF